MTALPSSIAKALPADRLRDRGLLMALVVWLAYTRVYWALRASHVFMPPCIFYYLTGHPCPFCGGTRSFAYMWEGDISDSVRLYPLGPALFAGTIAGAGALAVGLVTGRTWTPRLTSTQWRLLAIAAGSGVLLSWMLKLFVLGN